MCVYYDSDNGPSNDTRRTEVAVTELEVRYRQSTGTIIPVQIKRLIREYVYSFTYF